MLCGIFDTVISMFKCATYTFHYKQNLADPKLKKEKLCKAILPQKYIRIVAQEKQIYAPSSKIAETKLDKMLWC